MLLQKLPRQISQLGGNWFVISAVGPYSPCTSFRKTAADTHRSEESILTEVISIWKSGMKFSYHRAMGQESKPGFQSSCLISWKDQTGNTVKTSIPSRLRAPYAKRGCAQPHHTHPLFSQPTRVQTVRRNRAYLKLPRGRHTSLELEVEKYGRGNPLPARLLEVLGGSGERIYCCNLEPNA